MPRPTRLHDGVAAIDRPSTGAGRRSIVEWRIAGLFLAHGSLSLAAGRNPLEFVVGTDEAEPGAPARRAGAYGVVAAAARPRRGHVEEFETVGTFLRIVGGGAALLELEARQVSRSVRGDLNRVINAESANLVRAVAAAAASWRRSMPSKRTGGWRDNRTWSVLCRNPARDPEATFTELAERLQIHRSRFSVPGPDRMAVTPRRRGSGQAAPGALVGGAGSRDGRLTRRQGRSVADRGPPVPPTIVRSVMIAA